MSNTKFKIKLLVDSREAKIINYFNSNKINSDINFEIKQLDIGDFHFLLNNSLVLIIERKTMSDLESSIIDKRLREQKSRLINSNKQIIYLIENWNENYKNNRLPISTLKSSLLNILIRDKLQIYFTNNTKDTYNTLIQIANKLINSSQKDNDIVNLDYISNIKSIKKDNIKNNMNEIFLLQIPKIGPKVAKSVSLKYPNIMDLCNEYNKFETEKEKEELLCNLEIDSVKKRKVGKVSSKYIYQAFINKF